MQVVVTVQLFHRFNSSLLILKYIHTNDNLCRTQLGIDTTSYAVGAYKYIF